MRGPGNEEPSCMISSSVRLCWELEEPKRPKGSRACLGTAVEREGKNLRRCEDLCLTNRPSQGQSLALTVLSVPNSLDRGTWETCITTSTSVFTSPRRCCQGFGCKVRVRGDGFGVWGLGFDVWGVRFSCWGLGVGGWGLGFRIWG